MLWTYKARDSRGHDQIGNVSTTGDNAVEDYPFAYRQVTALRLLPIYVRPMNESRPLDLETIGEQIQVTIENLGTLQAARLAFWRVLKAMKKRGAQPIDAIAAYLPDCHSKRLTVTLRSMIADIEIRGRTFAQCLKARPMIFNAAHATMIEVTDGNPKQIDAIDSIIKEEQRARRMRSKNFGARIGSYVNYVLVAISLVLIARLYLPGFIHAQQQLQLNTQPPPALIVMSNMGNFFGSWYAIFLLAAVGVGVRALYLKFLQDQDFAKTMERLRWRNYVIREKTLSDERARALMLIAGMRSAAVDEVQIFTDAAASSASPHFKEGLLKQADLRRRGILSFEQTFAENPWWGGEIISQVAGATPGTYGATFEEMATDQEERAQGFEAAASAIGAIGHTLAAVALSAIVVSVVYISQYSLLISESRKIF